ncbi:Microtubule-associated protein 1A [Bienertia sinuspersici]
MEGEVAGLMLVGEVAQGLVVEVLDAEGLVVEILVVEVLVVEGLVAKVPAGVSVFIALDGTPIIPLRVLGRKSSSADRGFFQRRKMVSERVREVELKERGAKKSYEVIKLNDCCKVNRGFELKEFEEELKLREEKIKERCEELERKEKKVTEGFLECQRTLELKKEELIAKNRVLVFQEKKLIEQCVELLKKEVDDKYVSVELKEKEISKDEFNEGGSREDKGGSEWQVSGIGAARKPDYGGSKRVGLIEKEIDERFQVVELKEKEMSEGFRALELNKKRMNERCKRLELKEKQVYECLEVVKLREKQVNDGVHALEVKLMQLEDCSKRIELKQQKAAELREKQFNEGLKALEVKAKELEECCKMVDTRETELSSRQRELEMREHSINQLCQGLESKEKQIDEQRQSLELKEKESDEHCRSLELKEKELNEGEMKLKKKEMDDRSEAIEVKEKQIRRRRKVLDLREEQINERCKEQESEGKQQVKEENLLATSAVASSSISLPDDDIQSLCRNMDAEGLRSYLLQHVKDYDTLSDNLLDSLRLASDPAKLVLNVILSLYQLEFDEGSMRNLYLAAFFVASYNLAESHNADELLSHFITFCDEIDVCQPEQIPILCDALGLRKKITGIQSTYACIRDIARYIVGHCSLPDLYLIVLMSSCVN